MHKALGLQTERQDLLTQARQATNKLREALENEYRPIVVGDRHFTPSEGARFVAQHSEAHGWIPQPVRPGADLSVSARELARLYLLGTKFTAGEEQDARLPLPELAALPSERQFEMMVSEYQHLLTQDLTFGANRWRLSDRGSEALEGLANELLTKFSDGLRRQAWRPYAITAGLHGGGERNVWERLITHINGTVEANSRHALVLDQRPQLSPAMPVPEQLEVAIQIGKHIAAGGKLGFLQLATHSEWRLFIKTARVTAGQPSHPAHFAALARLAELKLCRRSLEVQWDAMIGQRLQKAFSLFSSVDSSKSVANSALTRVCGH